MALRKVKLLSVFDLLADSRYEFAGVPCEINLDRMEKEMVRDSQPRILSNDALIESESQSFLHLPLLVRRAYRLARCVDVQGICPQRI